MEDRLALVKEMAGSDDSIWPRLLVLLEEVVQANGDPERQKAAVAEMRRWIVLEAERSFSTTSAPAAILTCSVDRR